MSLSEIVAWAALALSVVLCVLLFLQTTRVGRIERQYRALMRGTGPAGASQAALSLGEMVSMQGARLDKAYDEVNALRHSVNSLESVTANTVQRVALVRYNPFQDTGGDQSFSLAMLDKHGDGVIISSLHGRTATRFYAKPVRGGTSALSLSDEEQQALQQAMGTRISPGG